MSGDSLYIYNKKITIFFIGYSAVNSLWAHLSRRQEVANNFYLFAKTNPAL
jgi:hypothetical protein